MVKGVWLLPVLASLLFCTVLCQVENSSEETERDPVREGKYIVPPFGRFPSDSTPCASTDDAIEISKHAGVDVDSIVTSRVYVEQKDPPNPEITELLQLLREFRNRNFQVPQYSGHFLDPATFNPGYQPTQNGEIPTNNAGFPPVGYPHIYPYPYPCVAGPCGPCTQYPCQVNNNTVNSQNQNEALLDQILSQTPSTTPLPTTGLRGTFASQNAMQDPFTTTRYPSTNNFLARPAETFDDVINQSRQQNLPNSSSGPFLQTTTPSAARTDDPVNRYNGTSYRTFQTTPMTAREDSSNYYYSPVTTTYSSPSTTAEETSTVYYPYSRNANRGSQLISPEDVYSSQQPANQRRYYVENVAVSYHPAASPSPAEEVPASYYPSRYRTQYSPTSYSDLSSYVAQNRYPSIVTAIEETVVEVPTTYTEGYYPSQTPGRYVSSSGYPSRGPLASTGYNRAYYPGYPMYQTSA